MYIYFMCFALINQSKLNKINQNTRRKLFELQFDKFRNNNAINNMRYATCDEIKTTLKKNIKKNCMYYVFDMLYVNASRLQKTEKKLKSNENRKKIFKLICLIIIQIIIQIMQLNKKYCLKFDMFFICNYNRQTFIM